MAIETDTDREILLSDFGVSASYTPQAYPHTSSKTTTKTVIMETRYVETNQHEGYRPIAYGRESDFSDAAHGDHITVESIHYKIKGIQPDGTGFVDLLLEKQ